MHARACISKGALNVHVQGCIVHGFQHSRCRPIDINSMSEDPGACMCSHCCGAWPSPSRPPALPDSTRATQYLAGLRARGDPNLIRSHFRGLPNSPFATCMYHKHDPDFWGHYPSYEQVLVSQMLQRPCYLPAPIMAPPSPTMYIPWMGEREWMRNTCRAEGTCRQNYGLRLKPLKRRGPDGQKMYRVFFNPWCDGVTHESGGESGSEADESE